MGCRRWRGGLPVRPAPKNYPRQGPIQFCDVCGRKASLQNPIAYWWDAGKVCRICDVRWGLDALQHSKPAPRSKLAV